MVQLILESFSNGKIHKYIIDRTRRSMLTHKAIANTAEEKKSGENN